MKSHGLFYFQTDQLLEINIAIKTCKMQDSAMTEAFLEEACKKSNIFMSILNKIHVFLTKM